MAAAAERTARRANAAMPAPSRTIATKCAAAPRNEFEDPTEAILDAVLQNPFSSVCGGRTAELLLRLVGQGRFDTLRRNLWSYSALCALGGKKPFAAATNASKG